MNKPTYVGKYQGYSIYADVHPVNKQLYNFTTAGSKDIFPNYLSIERFINSKTGKS